MNPYTESIRLAWENHNRDLVRGYNHVNVNRDKLDEFAANLATKDFELPSWRAPVFPQDDDENFLRFIFVANSINYCFTDFKTGMKFDMEYPEGVLWQGSFAMTACLKRAVDNGMPILNPAFLKEITLPEVEVIFVHKDTRIPMKESRLQQLRLLGEDMQRNGFNDFADVFKTSDYYVWRESGDCILKILEKFQSYEDFRIYEDLETRKACVLKFQKRAQLLAMIYHGRAVSSKGKLQPIRDPESIGPISDYQVPNALRGPDVGVLEYSKDLTRRIAEGKEIKENSIVEVSIRAKTVEVMQELLLLINWLRPQDKQITMAELDYYIWRVGRKSGMLHHYTYTTAY